MTTLSHLPPSLEVTAAADDMEISSDLGRFDNDIDIDLTEDHLGDGDGDYMLEDAGSDTGRDPSIHDQDMGQETFMFDEQENTAENVMEDETILLDADAIVEDPADTSMNHFNIESVDSLNFDDDFAEDMRPTDTQSFTQEPESIPSGGRREERVKTQEPAQATVIDGVHVRDFSEANRPGEGGGSVHQSENKQQQFAESHDTSQIHEEQIHLLPQESSNDVTETIRYPADKKQADPPFGADDKDFESHDEVTLHPQDHNEHNDSIEAQARSQPKDDSPYHSIIVVYEGAEVSLFPPRDQDESETFFLRDASLASRSICDLLRACREVLGETITEEQELQIEVHDLDLTIGEESAHALSTSFSELLEVYLSLHSLDGTVQPEPLYVTLTTKTRFSARLGSLRAAIADGRGMSQLWYDGHDEEYYLEHADLAGDDEGEVGSPQKVVDEQVEPAENVDEGPTTTNAQVNDTGFSAEGVGNILAPGLSSTGKTDNVADMARSDGDLEASNEAEHVGAAHNDKTGGAQVELYENELVSAAGQNLTSTSVGPSADPTISHTHANAGGNQEEEALIDFADQEDQDENNSSGSSTLVGDTSAGLEDAKAQSNSTVQENPAHAVENSETDQNDAENSGQPAFEYHDEDGVQFLGEQDNFSAEFDENAYDFDAVEDGDIFDSSLHEADPAAAGDETDQQNDHQTTTEAPAEEHDAGDQDEDWNDFLDSGEAQEQEEGEITNGEANEPSTTQPDFTASTETLVAGVDNYDDQQQQADNAAIDDFDEITYDEEDEDDFGNTVSTIQPQPTLRKPSASPSGKRSLTEHLEGDFEDTAELEAKRLRSA